MATYRATRQREPGQGFLASGERKEGATRHRGPRQDFLSSGAERKRRATRHRAPRQGFLSSGDDRSTGESMKLSKARTA